MVKIIIKTLINANIIIISIKESGWKGDNCHLKDVND